MAIKTKYITTIARAKSSVFSEMFAQINQLLKDAKKFKKSSQAFGIAIEVYCQQASSGGKPFRTIHRKNVTSWNLEELLAIPEARLEENVNEHNRIYAILKKQGKGRAGDTSPKAATKHIRNTGANSPCLNKFR
jgi:hypothetical protein